MGGVALADAPIPRSHGLSSDLPVAAGEQVEQVRGADHGGDDADRQVNPGKSPGNQVRSGDEERTIDPGDQQRRAGAANQSLADLWDDERDKRDRTGHA